MTPFTLSREQVRELDRRAIEGFGIPGIVLMENAGRGCAELLMKLNPERKPTVILCGPGNNGGDGFVIARHLDNHGWPVDVWMFTKPEGLAGDAAINHRIARSASIPFREAWPWTEDGWVYDRPVEWMAGLMSRGWVVDALFGTGLSRPIGHPLDFVVAATKGSGSSILAVDIPSGLDCDTGEPLGLGFQTVRATHTATFVAPKRGFLNSASREWTGEVHVIDIGAPRVLVEEYGSGRT